MACIINKLRSHPEGALVCRKMESRQKKKTWRMLAESGYNTRTKSDLQEEDLFGFKNQDRDSRMAEAAQQQAVKVGG